MTPTEPGSPPTARTRSAQRTRLVAVALVVFVLAIAALADGTRIPLIPTVGLRREINRGAAFGLGAELGPATAVVIALVLLALSAVVWRLAALAGGGVSPVAARFARIGYLRCDS